MARPTTIDELPAYERQGVLIATIQGDAATSYPKVGKHLMQALIEAQDAGLEVEKGEIRIPRTDEELAATLKAKQDSWDRGNAAYVAFLNDGTWPVYPWEMEAYCRKEGIEVPKKPEPATTTSDS